VTCRLCQKRPTKRDCPALREEICAVCCATKRLVEIGCPEDCRYLEAAQRHPAAVIKRQIDQDLGILMTTIGRLSEQQLQLLFVLQSMVLSYKPDGLARLTDADVAQATGALAASLETSSKGLIFEEPAASVPAEGLRRAIKPMLDEITKGGGARVEREVAFVLRGIERGARHEGGHIADGETTYLELVGRVFRHPPSRQGRSGETGLSALKPPDKPRIILP
jgi:hypothetical protein